ncbi:MAG: sigma-E processing peptidase SpoIIGA [Bacilli bacterium]|nr:sigma-E processing peptidase SpoIIGA [Bacilli bacterium]
MKIYIESVFLLNFLLDFMILFGTKKILRRKTKIYRMIFGSLMGSCTIFLLWIPLKMMVLTFLKIVIALLMNFISFGKEKLFENTFYFYLLSIIVGGFLELLHLNHGYYYNMLFLLLLCPMIIGFFIYQYKKYKENMIHKFQVKIYSNHKEYLFDGFIDTGNHLKSPISHKPVILIDQYIPHTKPYYIPYKALNYEGILECIKPDKVFINEVEIKKCLVGLSKRSLHLHDCHCILPNCIKEEL